ncbi:hypothetical protein C8J56DRAFT_954690 [Mycena floridula]|nr:hypothetical protein C8J56DRAFT_954690 [Mycena floridula]
MSSSIDAITAAFESIMRMESDWLLLAYGTDNLDELLFKMNDLSQVFIAFCREDVPKDPGHICINYIPHSVSGSRKARVFVHSRRIGAVFNKVQYATLTVDNLSNLTPNAIHKAISNPDTPHVIEMERSATSPSDITNTHAESIRRSFSETYAPNSPTATPPKSSGSMFSSFLRRKAPPKVTDIPQDSSPPPPPKDKGIFGSGRKPAYRHTTLPTSMSSIQIDKPLPVSKQSRNSFMDFGVISDSPSSDDDVVVVPPPSQAGPSSLSARIPSKWVTESIVVGDPAERARRRQEAQRQREIEEEQAIQEEKDRQARIKLRHEELKRQELRQEADRRSMLEREIERVKSERRRKEQREKEEEEMKRVELAMKKADERLKRQQTHAELEDWRKAQQKAAEEAAKRDEALARQEKLEREKRIKQIEAKVKSGKESQQGWVSVQGSDSMYWRRRYYKFSGTTMYLYKSPKEINHALDKLELRGEISALREWDEGYEELKALPHSFALEFKDRRGPWAMYTDTEEEKYTLLGLLKCSAGL